jgi:hypothetical protein
MRSTAKLVLPGLLLLAVPCVSSAAHTTSSRHPSVRNNHASLHHVTSKGKHNSLRHETSTMPSERATEIQTALIQRGYLTGQPNGTWDAASIASMQRFQADNGWQSKLTPDARALIKLGLGPDKQTADATPTTPRQ